jgi:hypothetical protein
LLAPSVSETVAVLVPVGNVGLAVKFVAHARSAAVALLADSPRA